MDTKFLIDSNVGKLAKWLRMMGYDALLFDEIDDGKMVKIALSQGRVIVTKDSEFMKRRAITSGRVRSILVAGDSPKLQMLSVLDELNLSHVHRPFTRCLECNTQLMPKNKAQVAGNIPPRVYNSQEQYMECPTCHRIYWRGTHWEAMTKILEEFGNSRCWATKGESL